MRVLKEKRRVMSNNLQRSHQLYWTLYSYENVQDTRAKNSFNARVIRFFGKCYQLIINNQVDTQRLILTFTQ